MAYSSARHFFSWRLKLICTRVRSLALGVLGKRKYALDIRGDTVKVVSRMERADEIERVNVCAHAFDPTQNEFACE